MNYNLCEHDMMIENGRHIELDGKYRYCHYCHSKGIPVIESEFHFLCEFSARENIFRSILPKHKDQIFFFVSDNVE